MDFIPNETAAPQHCGSLRGTAERPGGSEAGISGAESSGWTGRRAQEFQLALVSLRSMRGENTLMRQNFEALRRLHEGLGRKHAAALADLQNLQVERAARESEVGGTIDGLALQLEEAKRRFEEAAPHILQPPALRSMQENLRREATQPLKARIADLEALVREKSGAYSQIWKENQVLQANVSSEVTKAQGEIGRCKAQHMAVLEEDRTIRDLTKLAESKRDPDLRYKAAERKAAEESARKANLEKQLQELLETKAQEEVERAKAWAEINRQKSELQKSALEKERAVSAAERRAQHLRNDLDSSAGGGGGGRRQLLGGAQRARGLDGRRVRSAALGELPPGRGAGLRPGGAGPAAGWAAERLAALGRRLARTGGGRAGEGPRAMWGLLGVCCCGEGGGRERHPDRGDGSRQRGRAPRLRTDLARVSGGAGGRRHRICGHLGPGG